jgi:hypothetical protein
MPMPAYLSANRRMLSMTSSPPLLPLLLAPPPGRFAAAAAAARGRAGGASGRARCRGGPLRCRHACDRSHVSPSAGCALHGLPSRARCWGVGGNRTQLRDDDKECMFGGCLELSQVAMIVVIQQTSKEHPSTGNPAPFAVSKGGQHDGGPWGGWWRYQRWRSSWRAGGGRARCGRGRSAACSVRAPNGAPLHPAAPQAARCAGP